MRANNFQILVKDSKKTLKIISEETGISYSTLGNYNQGTRNPKRENAEILAKYFGVSTAYIMGIDEASEAKVVPEYQMIGELFFNLLMDVTNQTVYEGVITTITLNHKKFKLTVEEIEDDDITRTED
ncbi:TPA: helix-turn-helix transcriptional regulator [Streptococcus suis]|nr:helix-turn-helix transcriptional regulator [Streptococcus suis]